MDAQLIAVGDRIRQSLPRGMTQTSLAAAADMTPDSLSRALNGKRGFTLTEITRIATVLDVDLTWLLTSEPGRHRVSIAARHDWDPVRRERSNPNHSTDSPILDTTMDLYRQAFPDGPPASTTVPDRAFHVRQKLGSGFVRTFAERIEEVFDIDVVRLPGLRTAYSLRTGQRGVILLGTDANWFRSNWSLAHELGHLALGHHEAALVDKTLKENDADAFAADLLLPADEMKAHAWNTMDANELGRLLWTWGVSTRSLATRLRYLRLPQSTAVSSALEGSTPAVLKRMTDLLEPPRNNRRTFADRRQQSSAPRYPLVLVEALTDGVESGRVSPHLLAGVLGVDVDDMFMEHDTPPLESEAAAAERILADHTMPAVSPTLSSWLQNR